MGEEVKLKKCSKCGKELPSRKDYFCVKNSKKGTFESECKECKKARNKERSERIKNQSKEKVCIKCNKTLNKSKNFHRDKNNEDGYSNTCKDCEDKITNVKSCARCEREFPATLNYFHKDVRTKDGLSHSCKECRTGKEVFNINKPKQNYKFCIKCDRELPIDDRFFPLDDTCIDGYRNVCRECGADGHFMEEGYISKRSWTDEENQLFIERYPNYTNRELIEKFYPNETEKSLWDKAYRMNCSFKTEYARNRANEHKGLFLSEILKGRIISEETRKKLSKTKKEQYMSGKLISPWKGRTVSEEERRRTSDRNKGKWSGAKNPRVSNPLYGNLNGRWEGGKKPLYFDLRDHIQEWKDSSMKDCNYRCVLTGLWFSNIHHLYPFRKIVDEVFENVKLGIRPKIGDYTENEIDLIHNELKSLHIKYGLGVCLSKKMHKMFHDKFGYTENTPKQFEEFTEKYFKGVYDVELEEELKSNNSIKRLKELNMWNKNHLKEVG